MAAIGGWPIRDREFTPQMAIGAIGMPRQCSLTEWLHGQRDELKSRLEEIDKVLSLLAAHPETQLVLDAVSKLR